MAQKRNSIYKILSLALGFSLASCSGSTPGPDDTDPDGTSNVTTLPSISTTIDRIVFINADSTLRINGGSGNSRYNKKFKLDDKNGDITIKFENVELKDFVIGNDLITAQFKDWENTAVEIANKKGATAESVDAKEKATKIYNKKSYQTPMFYNFKDRSALEKFWQNVSDHSWSIVTDSEYNKDFKYQGKDWRYK